MKRMFKGRFLFFGGMIFARPYWWIKKYLLGHNYKTFNDAVKRLNNPLDIQCFMFTEFKYISDVTAADQWQTPERTWSRKGGDCEDWALFAMKCMGAVAHKVFVLSFYPKKSSGHATCVVDEGKDSWITMGTFGLRRVKGPLSKIPEKWYPDWRYMKVTDKHGNKTTINRD
jgi:hypothetical protein